MAAYKYLIVGGGMAADAAVRGIRQVDSVSAIGMVSSEPYPPYTRPYLSKGLWRGKPYERVWRNTPEEGVEFFLGRTITSLDLVNQQAYDDKGSNYTYEKLLLATGGSPRHLPIDADDIIYFRSLADYEKLKKLSEEKQEFVVIGGGFIGSEIAAALAMQNCHVTMVFPDDGIGADIFPRSMAIYLNDYYRQKGVDVCQNHRVTNIEFKDGAIVTLSDQKKGSQMQVKADAVIAGIGIRPETSLAEKAGLKIDNGIQVDDYLVTSDPNVYAAGDVASFYYPALNTRMRVEHEDNALTMGMIAGKNMAGEHSPYHHLPYFYSDLFDLGYEAVGRLDSQKEMVVDWKEVHQKGVIYYLSERRVRGVLLWNVWEQVDNARKLISEPGPFIPQDLLGRIPM